MINVLFPTDFSIASLDAVVHYLENSPAIRHKVFLVYGYYLDDSITELLFYSPDDIIQELTTDGYRDALEVIKSRFESRISESPEIRLFHGKSKRSLVNFIKALDIHTIVIPEEHQFDFSGNRIDMAKELNSLVAMSEFSFEKIRIKNIPVVLSTMFK